MDPVTTLCFCYKPREKRYWGTNSGLMVTSKGCEVQDWETIPGFRPRILSLLSKYPCDACNLTVKIAYYGHKSNIVIYTIIRIINNWCIALCVFSFTCLKCLLTYSPSLKSTQLVKFKIMRENRMVETLSWKRHSRILTSTLSQYRNICHSNLDRWSLSCT